MRVNIVYAKGNKIVISYKYLGKRMERLIKGYLHEKSDTLTMGYWTN